ncbi:MAG: ABC transporter ATP-binding protein [alpha proteobacterium MED-G10]|nr:ABC transporter ATP-binding protein [Rickettsiales bacterium]MAT32831.1 ABC transporter ATP-binding protein [Rickettsiales bacterium]PDH56119.1 MAG: ABC transporter ATP-binding protein [alpha proteobacterium MED-G10]|tara:strand:- start:4815 stop:5525 length:711 start_codon:yes stop_codon:yes gene_type:complete
MRKTKIKIKGLSKNFGEKKVLKNLDLNIYESESLAIIGESGSGKSVLTKCIDGLESFDSGIISYDNIENIGDLKNLQKDQYMTKFGILFQNAALLDSLTVKENLEFSQKKNVKEILKDLSIPENLLNEYPNTLSIGVQKRIGLARAILKNPEILILDEPTTGLDPIISKQINLIIKKLVKEKKITTITVTHDMNSVYEFSDYTAFIKNGSISWYGKSKDIKKNGNKPLLNFVKGIY